VFLYLPFPKEGRLSKSTTSNVLCMLMIYLWK
jgi:hypothetical protein